MSYDLKVLPKQPFFVLSTRHYSKTLLYKYGISHFYSFHKDDQNENDIIAIPDGCVDILFCVSGQKKWAKICGSVMHAEKSLVHILGDFDIFGVRFLPGIVPSGFNIKMSNLIEQQIDLENVECIPGFTERMLSKRTYDGWYATFMEYYLKFWEQEKVFDSKTSLVNYIRDEIVRSAGTVCISKMIENSGYSDRYVNRLFKAEFGMVPKQFAKIMRFQYLLDHLTLAEDENIDFAELSVKLGYYDQAHMIKNFKDYTGITPTKYIKLMNEENFNKRLIVM